MSTTRTLQRRRPAAHAPTTAPAHAPTHASAHAPAQAPTSAPAPIGPADVEAALLDNYPDLVRLAYANLPARLPRHYRVLAAHTVVQHALQGHEVVEATDAKAFVRRRVQENAIKQAQARTPLRGKPKSWALHLLALTEPSGVAFDPCSLKPVSRAELLQRNARAANLVIVVTTLLALGILTSLLINR